MYKENKHSIYITSDLPRIVTDLPFLKVSLAKNLKFNHESIWGIKYNSWKINTEKERLERDKGAKVSK